MKKIMFNDRYDLTLKVLNGHKTQTRREAYDKPMQYEQHVGSENGHLILLDGWEKVAKSVYRVGEEIAIAQRYSDFRWPAPQRSDFQEILHSAGWNNKMFVRADLMPHRIRIKNIKVERLQDISEEDCLREGIQEYFPYIDRNPNDRVRTFQYFRDGKIRHRMSPAPECFALLIDDICGKGTWERNPWVFAYSFELCR